MIAFIDPDKDRFSVECLCHVINEHTEGGFLTPHGYRLVKPRPPSSRFLRDEQLLAQITQIHYENYGVYGVRKMWHAMRRAD